MYFTPQATGAGRSSCQTGTTHSPRDMGWDLGLGFAIPNCSAWVWRVGNGASPQHHHARPSTLKQKMETGKAQLHHSWLWHQSFTCKTCQAVQGNTADPGVLTCCPPPKQATHLQCAEETCHHSGPGQEAQHIRTSSVKWPPPCRQSPTELLQPVAVGLLRAAEVLLLPREVWC